MKLALALVLLAACAANGVKQDNSWDFLLYTARWAGTAAFPHSVPSNVSSFTLHGIWPNRNDGSYPSFCTNTPFDPAQIADLIPVLKTVWYDYQHASGYSFWTHEWTKHGTCAASDPVLGSEHAYFAGAINMHKGSAIRNALSQGGIYPSNSKTYTLGAMKQAIQSNLGFEPIISCQSLSGLGKAISVVQLCYDKSLRMQACPSNISPEGGCTANTPLYYPVITN